MKIIKLLKELKLKGYLVKEAALIPINHNDIIKTNDMYKQVIVIKLEDVIRRISK